MVKERFVFVIDLFFRFLLNNIQKLYFKFLLRSNFEGLKCCFPYKGNVISKPIYILGNGPSIISVLENKIEFLKGCDLVAVNSFPESHYFELLRPSFLFVADPVFIYDEDKVASFRLEQRTRWVAAIHDKVNWPLNIVVPYWGKDNVKQMFSDMPNIQISCYNTTHLDIQNVKKIDFYKLSRENLYTPKIQNVLVGAIYFFLNQGRKKIRILGAEHNWLQSLKVTEDNLVTIHNSHVYNEDGERWTMSYKGGRSMKLYEVLEAYREMFFSYQFLNEYAISLSAEIINLTPNSLIDAFRKEKLDFTDQS